MDKVSLGQQMGTLRLGVGRPGVGVGHPGVDVGCPDIGVACRCGACPLAWREEGDLCAAELWKGPRAGHSDRTEGLGCGTEPSLR